MEKLEGLLLNSVDETLKRIFITEDIKVIYGYLRKKFDLKPEEIAEKPEVFSAGLKSLLDDGALWIEKLILKNLYSELRLEFEDKEDYKFSDYLKELWRSPQT